MANSKSAKKRILIAERNRQKNNWYKARIRKLLKDATKTKEIEKVKIAISLLDKAASKNILSRNKASRKKSQLMKLAKA